MMPRTCAHVFLSILSICSSCEVSKYIFFLHTGSGPLYKPATRDFELVLKVVNAPDAEKLSSSWQYWALQDSNAETVDVPEEGPHPDQHVIL